MSCKEGEGVFIITPKSFATSNIVDGGRYRVIVLANGQVQEDSWVDASLSATKFIQDNDLEMHLHIHDDKETVTLFSRSRLFMTWYPDNWDLIIKSEDGRTGVMVPNIEVVRG